MDYENQILGMRAGEDADSSAGQRQRYSQGGAPGATLPIIYVVVRFRDGYPEVSRQNKRFAGLKESGRLREGTPGAEISVRVAPPTPGDIVVTKRRVGRVLHHGFWNRSCAPTNISTLALSASPPAVWFFRRPLAAGHGNLPARRRFRCQRRHGR